MNKKAKEIDWTKYPQDRKELYDYCCSLGYDERTAAVLALFIFGSTRSDNLRIDQIYGQLTEETEVIPREYDMTGYRGNNTGMPAGFGASGNPLSSVRTGYRAARRSPGGITDSLPDCAPEPKKHQSLFDRFFSGGMADGVRSSARGRKSKQTAASFKASDPGMSASMTSGFMPSAPMPDASMTSGFMPSAPMPAASMASGFMPSALPATDEYEQIEEKGFRDVKNHMTSTFRMTTNTASAGIIFNQLRENRRIDRNMVRIEEMLNYFRYQSVIPDTEKFRISCELMPAAQDGAAGQKKLLYINVQGKEEVKQRQNIVLLLDVSGSMCINTYQVQAAVATIISKLNAGDKISLVTYSSRDEVILRGFTIKDDKDKIKALEKFLGVNIYGCTNGSAGIVKAYQIGKEEYIEGGNNQVILITDGDLNFGITDKGGLTELIEEKKKSNLFLSVIGTGLSNYKDDKLEVLSKHGNGVYRVVNNLADVKKCIDTEYASLVNVIAKDVKAQVEFNPEVVESFRLLGFENRELDHEDFVNDKVISEPFGSGGYGVALYELELRDGSKPVESGYKYAKVVTTGSKDLGTVKVRYKDPLEDASTEIEYEIRSADDNYTDNIKLAYVVYVCAEKLRGSDKIGEKDIMLASKFCGELGTEIREMNKSDYYKLPEILRRSPGELNVGIHSGDRFVW